MDEFKRICQFLLKEDHPGINVLGKLLRHPIIKYIKLEDLKEMI